MGCIRFLNYEMNQSTLKMRNLAERLTAYEATGHQLTDLEKPETFLIIEKLRPHLANLMGKAGFFALLSRSLALASTDVLWLGMVHLKSNGALEAFDPFEAHVSPEDFFEGKVVLLAAMLGLLVGLIGEELTLQLMRKSMPQLSINDLDLNPRDPNEKIK